MIAALQPAHALLDPVHAVPQVVASRRWVWPALLLMASVAFSGAAFAVRWDAGPHVIRGLAEAGELDRLTEKEIADKIVTAGRVELVSGVARGVFAIPVLLLLLATALKLTGWLLARPIGFIEALAAGAVALVPIAAYHLVFGAVALASDGLSLAARETLVPHHLGQALRDPGPIAARLASTVDVFNLWATALLGLGFARGTGMSRAKGLLVALALYAAFAGVFLVGLPGMGGGGK